MTFEETKKQTYRIEVCCNCGVEFAMTEEVYAARRRDGERFYCTNGHGQVYTESDKKRIAQLEAEKTALQAKVRSERDARLAAERARERAKAQAKRMENRAAASLCPYCNRSFATVRMQRHIHAKHPEKAHEVTT